MKNTIIGYNIYHAPDGCAPEFYGRTKTIAAGKSLAAAGRALPASLWDTARAAGHCGGLVAPEGREAEEPAEWFGGDGYDCAVAVFAE